MNSGLHETITMASERKRVQSNGLNFVVTDEGDAGATPVVLLHGFPNCANVWDKQVIASCSVVLFRSCMHACASNQQRWLTSCMHTVYPLAAT